MIKPTSQVKFRMPPDLKQWLESQAKARYHSMQAELLGIISEAKRRDEQTSQA